MKKKLNPIIKQRIELYGGILLMLLICVGIVKTYRIVSTHKYGQTLDGTGDPVQIVRPFTVERISQEKYDVPMGGSDYTVSEQGSLLACMSAALQVNGQETDVLALNTLLLETGVYREGAVIDWDALEKSDAFAVQSVKAPPSFSSKDIHAYLSQGALPIVKVHVEEKERWLVITGEDILHGFSVADPMRGEAELYLREYGGVYALRVLL